MYLIGITGGSGSGKTTFAKKLIKYADSPEIGILHMDSYYLDNPPQSVYTDQGQPNFDHPDSFDWDLLYAHLKMLKENQPVKVPVYDFETNRRKKSEWTELGPCKILLFEGIFTLFYKNIRDILDIKCFLQVDADIRFTRRLHRDTHERGRSVESVIAQYYETVRPMYQKYLDPQRQFADFIVGEETDTAAQILAAKVKNQLEVIKNNPHQFMPKQVDSSQEGEVYH